jgi:hypothetical protein
MIVQQQQGGASTFTPSVRNTRSPALGKRKDTYQQRTRIAPSVQNGGGNDPAKMQSMLGHIQQQIEKSKLLEKDRERVFYSQRQYKAAVTGWNQAQFGEINEGQELWMGKPSVTDHNTRRDQVASEYVRMTLGREKRLKLAQRRAAREAKLEHERKRKMKCAYLEAERIEKIMMSRSVHTQQRNGPPLQYNHYPQAHAHRQEMHEQQEQPQKQGQEQTQLQQEPSTQFVVEEREVARLEHRPELHVNMGHASPDAHTHKPLPTGARVTRFNESRAWYNKQFPLPSSSSHSSSSSFLNSQHHRRVHGADPRRATTTQILRHSASSSGSSSSSSNTLSVRATSLHTTTPKNVRRVRPKSAHAGMVVRHGPPSIGGMWHGQATSLCVSGSKVGSVVHPTPWTRPRSSTGLRSATKVKPSASGARAAERATKQQQRPKTAGAVSYGKKKKRKPSLIEKVRLKKESQAADARISRPDAAAMTRYKLFRSGCRYSATSELLMSVTMDGDKLSEVQMSI